MTRGAAAARTAAPAIREQGASYRIRPQSRNSSPIRGSSSTALFSRRRIVTVAASRALARTASRA